MKALVTTLLMFLCILSYAQLNGPKECDWNPKEKPTFRYVRVDDPDNVPEIWKKVEHCHHIIEVFRGWKIYYGGYVIMPDYVVYYEDSYKTPYDACQYAYNYFSQHPNEEIYKDDEFVVYVYKKKVKR